VSALADPAPNPLTGLRLILAGVLLSLGNFMVVLDTTIANVSVPHIAGSLAAAPSQGTWVITSYSVAEAITVPLTGWLVQRFGGVRVFAGAMLGFGAFSLACGMAPTFGLLVTFRVLQGLCGGPLMPVSQTLLLHLFPRDRSAQALGVWSITVVLAPIAGPLLGGWISDTIGWSWIFLLNVPVAAGLVFGAWAMLRSHETPSRRVPVDYVGLVLLALWVGALQIMLDKGKELEWFASTTIVILAVTAAIGFAAFLIWELTAEHPIVDLKIFRHRGFVAGVITISVNFGIFFGSLVLIPLWLQTSLGYTSTWAGRASAMNGVLAVAMSPIAAALLRKFDARMLVSLGVLGMSVIALWRALFTTEVTFWNIALPYLAQGFVMPFYFVPTTSIVMSSVLPQEMASAAGMSNFLRSSAAAFCASIMTTQWENIASAKRSQMVGSLNDVHGAVAAIGAHGLTPAQAIGQIEGMIQQQAMMLAANQLFVISSVLLFFAASIIWLAPKPHGQAAGGGGH
jgi:DHA2 family multidrug resistance protein